MRASQRNLMMMIVKTRMFALGFGFTACVVALSIDHSVSPWLRIVFFEEHTWF